MKGSKLKSKISHLFKGKSNKLEKFPTYDSTTRISEPNLNINENVSVHGNKKIHKKPKTGLNIIDTKRKNLGDFPVLPSPITDANESAKLTAQEFAKAVGIKILHRTDEEEDEECDCEYCRAHLNTVNTMDQKYSEESNTPMQQIPNVSLNQLSVNNASIASSNNSTTSNNVNTNFNIPPFPAFNMNFCNDKMSKCSSSSSISSNHSIVNSKTIGTPGYSCHRNRKNSISKVVDMSMFVPPTEEEIKRVHSSSLSINSTPESSSIQTYVSNDKIMGGSLDRNRNVGYKKNYYGINPIATRERSISTSIASTSRNNAKMMMNNDYRTSPIFKESSIGHSSRIQFKSYNRCDSGTELSNANTTINPSSPNKRPYPNSLASSSSSTTLSSSLSLTHISQPPNLAQIPSSQSSSSQSSIQKCQIPSSLSLQSVKYSPKPSNVSTPIASAKSSVSSCSLITPVKPHSNFKITRSVTISEGTRCAEIDIQPIQPDEVKVYTKGRFTITCEHSRRPSAHSFQIN